MGGTCRSVRDRDYNQGVRWGVKRAEESVGWSVSIGGSTGVGKWIPLAVYGSDTPWDLDMA